MYALFVNGALAAIAVGLLILVHELGHFMAAKAVGIRVEVFSIGFWKKVIAFRKGDTEYRLSAIPLGGYLKMAGELPEEGSGRPDELWSKTPGQRALVFSAGVLLNVVLAIALFIVAFAIGVPFAVAEVGQLEKDWPAWTAGMREGDKIVEINGRKEPDFQDVGMIIGLGGDETVSLAVQRGQETLTFEFETRYDKELGFRRIGFSPPFLTAIYGLAEVGDGKRRPAEEVGLKVGDRILAINGEAVETDVQVGRAVQRCGGEQVSVLVERDGSQLSLTARPEAVPQYLVGISCLSSAVKSLQMGGVAHLVGFEVGDNIVAVNGRQIHGVMDLEEAVKDSYGTQTLTVRRDGEDLTLHWEMPDRTAFDELLSSVAFESGTTLTWVNLDGPAWNGGLRVGDRVLSVGGRRVESWQDILTAGGAEGRKPRVIEWERDGRTHAATVQPVDDRSETVWHIGVLFGTRKTRVVRYGILGSVSMGFYKTYGTVMDFLLTLKGMASREVSPKTLGGVITIVYASYRAAQEGAGKLIYWTAFISVMLAFVNILPIPVLDGGHLLFVAIEKVRGRPLSRAVMAITQYVGLTLLLALVIYVTTIDILRWFVR